MVYVDVFVAGVGKWYEFKCEETALIRDIIKEIYDVIRDKESIICEKQIDLELYLACIENKRILPLDAKIANYYNTFLLNGTDQSGERGTGDFMDFYKTLHSLNQFEVTQKSTKSDLAAAYLISREITIEIMNYAEQFLKDSSINKKMLNKELEKIEERTKYFIKEKKQMEELYQFMNEAKQKIEIADSFKDKEDVRDAGGT